MRKIVSILVLFITLSSVAQIKAKVQKVNGFEVYLLAEPVREYEAVKGGGKGIQWSSAITGGLINESIATKVSKYIKKLAKQYKDENIKFDAVVYTNGKQMTAIKFTDEKTPENSGIAVVQKINGIPFFVMSEPVKEYEFVKTLGAGIKWKSAITGGLINNSIEEDLMKFAKKAENKFKKKKISAIIYDRGKKANTIKFN
ncbi:hypothetical protein M4I21_05175 [Cellulophaga sp. 20_2_10]|uniref:hypothetical protein n=1 Tax=Cellulophaga sp. 20_2_10 TaxID=2942476 RepID=UPI00201B284A|nr:hypothetical protein [Cellulophaga sp. 20_2_10]MCL5245190.1 hypothetical protein [Cellulophaga sp. 20_2_10]